MYCSTAGTTSFLAVDYSRRLLFFWFVDVPPRYSAFGTLFGELLGILFGKVSGKLFGKLALVYRSVYLSANCFFCKRLGKLLGKLFVVSATSLTEGLLFGDFVRREVFGKLAGIPFGILFGKLLGILFVKLLGIVFGKLGPPPYAQLVTWHSSSGRGVSTCPCFSLVSLLVLFLLGVPR